MTLPRRSDQHRHPVTKVIAAAGGRQRGRLAGTLFQLPSAATCDGRRVIARLGRWTQPAASSAYVARPSTAKQPDTKTSSRSHPILRHRIVRNYKAEADGGRGFSHRPLKSDCVSLNTTRPRQRQSTTPALARACPLVLFLACLQTWFPRPSALAHLRSSSVYVGRGGSSNRASLSNTQETGCRRSLRIAKTWIATSAKSTMAIIAAFAAALLLCGNHNYKKAGLDWMVATSPQKTGGSAHSSVDGVTSGSHSFRLGDGLKI